MVKAKARRDRKSKNAKPRPLRVQWNVSEAQGYYTALEVGANSLDGKAGLLMVAKVSNVQVVEGTGVSWVASHATML
jgi:hypothetical protein